MRIINLEVQNFKRLSAVNITPDGKIVIIGGKNGAGKSSVLDAIQSALAGGQALPEMPIKKGENKALISVNLGEFIVTRKFRKKEEGTVASEVEIKNSEGFKKSSPQALLDSLYGKMTFDPLEFSRLKPKDQLEQLKELVGIDFTDQDKKKDEFYLIRTDLNRKLKEKEAQIKSIEFRNDIPESEISISALMEELKSANDKNLENAHLRSYQDKKAHELSVNISRLASIECQIEKLIKDADFLKNEIRQQEENFETVAKSVKSLSDIDTSTISEKIKNAEKVNYEIRRQKQRIELTQQHEALKNNSDLYTRQINEIERDKSLALSQAKFPIFGMGFDENGVTMHGIPFSQCSSAEKLKISVAMGIALNPKLKIMQIRDGSLLDDESLKLIDEMAKESDTQIWIERVGKGSECSVIISDGYVDGDDQFL